MPNGPPHAGSCPRAYATPPPRHERPVPLARPSTPRHSPGRGHVTRREVERGPTPTPPQATRKQGRGPAPDLNGPPRQKAPPSQKTPEETGQQRGRGATRRRGGARGEGTSPHPGRYPWPRGGVPPGGVPRADPPRGATEENQPPVPGRPHPHPA